MNPTESSPIEKHIKVVSASASHSDVFKNQYTLWRPSLRGIFGGIAIAQSLRAAQLTVPDGVYAHSMHCSFVSAGNGEDTINYHVERIRDGKSFCLRLVRAIQINRTIFIATISFTSHQILPESKFLEHAINIPNIELPSRSKSPRASGNSGIVLEAPFINKSAGILKGKNHNPSDKRIHQWIRARGAIDAPAGDPVHLAALAFMSDSYLLAAVPHCHQTWLFEDPPVTEFYSTKEDLFTSPKSHTPILRPHLESSTQIEGELGSKVTMMVSLDHIIYFHNVKCLKADEWLLTEVQTSWSGNARGLIHQKIWAGGDGTLLATCIQEGIIRLDKDQDKSLSKTCILNLLSYNFLSHFVIEPI
ncbi:hypothetical protein N7462_001102 [Penicillium macrosclerotiorum]|uniref:uncharacterized protein n=1 Tax=Penicillium macrosclerotiorum TaxID=303699 RepID=UPI0025468BCE|nr:uncharacterized protein N7462_001102 [Penicillium macrosclerotiorum]KAJ5699097.1 hypothetical protein N7462_001102 [Penicillium macrosclerotiorum]